MTEQAPENERKSSENCEINAELCPWVCQKPELGVKYKRCKNRGGLRPDGNIPLKMLNLAAFVNTFRKEDDNMMNEIHEELKIMTVWLTKNESADPALRDRLTKECVENSKGYKVAVFFSGNDNLYETTSALLRYNRKRMAQMEVEKEKRPFRRSVSSLCFTFATERRNLFAEKKLKHCK